MFNPCCCDEDLSCTAFFDDFERDDANPIDNGWNERLGTVQLIDGELSLSADSIATMPASTFNRRVSFRFKGASGDCMQVGLYRSSVFGNQIIGFEIIVGESQHNTNTYLKTVDKPAVYTDPFPWKPWCHKPHEVTAGEWHTIVIYDYAIVIDDVWIGTHKRPRITNGDTTTFLNAIGGGAQANALVVDDFRLCQYASPGEEPFVCCGGEPADTICAWPDATNMPAEITVTISDLAGGCAFMNGTYVLDKGTGLGRCGYSYYVAPVPGFGASSVIDMVVGTGILEQDGTCTDHVDAGPFPLPAVRLNFDLMYANCAGFFGDSNNVYLYCNQFTYGQDPTANPLVLSATASSTPGSGLACTVTISY